MITPNPFTTQTSREIWDFDAFKLSKLKELRDYNTIIVWEQDYRKSPVKTVIKCITQIEEYKNV